MMKREKGFTLVELLSVVVILGVTFMFVLPKLVGLINDGEDKETNPEDLTRSEYLNPLSHRDVLDIITCEGFVVGVHVGIEGEKWAPASCNVFFNTESPKILNWGCKYGGHYYDFVNIYAMYSMVFRPLPGEMNG